jgi:ferredoxin-NADP reductase
MNSIDTYLNKITMYRLVVYVLGAYAALSIVFAFFNRLPFTPSDLVYSFFLVLGAAYATDRGFGKLFGVPTNMESSLITSLILFLIVQPVHSTASALALLLAGVLSSASKFLLAWHGKHLFNPAAFAAAVLSLSGLGATTWWIGSSVFWPYTLVLGLLIVRKIRRFPMFVTFIAVCLAVHFALFSHAGMSPGTGLKQALIASPLIFLSTIMLTEPATMPPRRFMQLVFAAGVASLYITGRRIGPIIIYPEVALLLGNLGAYVVSPKSRIRLKLKAVNRISDQVYDYVFQPDKAFTFLAGQYMEWTLPGVSYDSRGNRRTFTVASSPTEEDVHLGVKFYEPASAYKAKLESLKPGDTMYASQLAGNFTLKGNEGKKLVFMAGGIGITPFRSMIKYVTDMNMSVDIILLYVVGDSHEFAYVREIQEAARAGVRAVPVVTDLSYSNPKVTTAKVSADLLSKLVPDYAERIFYISGPSALVDVSKGYLRSLGVTGRNIRTDHFSGY